MVEHRRRFTPKDEAVKLVIDSGRPISAVAKDLGLNEGTLGGWVATWRRAHRDDTEEEPLTISERARLRKLEKENRELRMECEFPSKAAAFFAQRHQRPTSTN
ncbi:transposase [Frankia sp. R43]|nr:transposase [Frankia sp. R43]